MASMSKSRTKSDNSFSWMATLPSSHVDLSVSLLSASQHVGLGLGLAQVIKEDDRDLRKAQELCRFVAAMTSNNLPVPIDQDRRVETERFDAFGDCSYLRAAMLAGIITVRDQIPDRDK
jgi:hypothetical protein